MDKQFAFTMHERAGNLPMAWQIQASDLLFAADVLEERRLAVDRESAIVSGQIVREQSLLAPALMLRGMALECLLKGLWLIRGNTLVRNGRYVGVPNAGDHNLVQLAQAAGFDLMPLERDMLRRLSCFIEYGGRYPIPRYAEGLMLVRTPRGGAAQSTHWITPSDSDLLASIIERLDTLFDEPTA